MSPDAARTMPDLIKDHGTPPGMKPPRDLAGALLWASDAAPVLDQTSLVHDLLGQQALAAIVGGPGTGKSTLALDLCLHVAAGEPWRGHDCTRCAVLYLAPEGSVSSARNRLSAHFRRHPGHRAAPFALLPQLVDLHDPQGDTAALIQLAAEVEATAGDKVGLIVVDTLARAMGGGDENTAGDMGAFVGNADRIRLATGATVLIVHHHGKDAARGARGHNSFFGALDTELTVTGTGNPRTVEVTKQRDLPGGLRFAFDLAPVDLGTDKKGRPVTACAVHHLEELPQVQAQRPAGRAQVAILTLLEQKARLGGVAWTSLDIVRLAREELGQAKSTARSAVATLTAAGFLVPTVGGLKLAEAPGE